MLVLNDLDFFFFCLDLSKGKCNCSCTGTFHKGGRAAGGRAEALLCLCTRGFQFLLFLRPRF